MSTDRTTLPFDLEHLETTTLTSELETYDAYQEKQTFYVSGEFSLLTKSDQIDTSNSSKTIYETHLKQNLNNILRSTFPHGDFDNLKINITKEEDNLNIMRSFLSPEEESLVKLKVTFEDQISVIGNTSFTKVKKHLVYTIGKLNGVVPSSMTMNTVPECSKIGSHYGDAIDNPDGCCFDGTCALRNKIRFTVNIYFSFIIIYYFLSRIQSPIQPPSRDLIHLSACDDEDHNCCAANLKTSYSLMAKSPITGTLVNLVQNDQIRQSFSQYVCGNDSCTGEFDICKQVGITQKK